MKKHYQKIPLCILAACMIFVILTAGCTYNGPNPLESTPATPTNSVTAETTQSVQSGSTQPAVSWKDFYPDHTEQEKSQLIEEAKGEVMSTFPDLDKSTLNGNWVEHSRITDDGLEEIGRPYIKFEGIKSTSDDEKYAVFVDPESMKIIYYTPYSGSHTEPVISFNEAKEKAIDFIRETQGDDSIADDPDTYIYTVNCYERDEFGLPVALVNIYKKSNGITYTDNYVMAEYDMNKDNIERYHDNLANSELLSGLTTLSAQPEISFDEAVNLVEDKIAEKYNLDEIGVEYSEVTPYDSYLLWWDDDNIVYADDPDPVPLVWYAGISDENSREESQETGLPARCGAFIVDAHTGEIYRLVYGDIKIKTYGYMG
ncbi:hypothetical protein [Methanolacinia paynteri]|uniref:hypothetical protein n=1 Tax=Methanolacinia paynteri TaxID=230356 RepID=UPI00064F3F3B|nr:hypothetical protein [Methanolacinia paynteri]